MIGTGLDSGDEEAQGGGKRSWALVAIMIHENGVRGARLG